MLGHLNSSGAAGLPANNPSFWNKFKPKPKDPEPAGMSIARTRLLTLVVGEMETIRVMPNSFLELESTAREWLKPPPDAMFTLRAPVEYVSIQAARLVSGPYIYLTGEESYQIASMGVQGLRVEIVSDAPPPADEPPPPPPPPVLDMPAYFSLELNRGQMVALDVSVVSDELDMARMEDGTTVDGSFWGKLDIVHQGDTHKMEFSGARIPADDETLTPEFLIDSRVLRKLPMACKPSTAKCSLSLLAPAMQYCEVTLSFSQLWSIGNTWPPAEPIAENKVKYFLRVHPGGALEHFENEIVTTALYYEAIPNPDMVDPAEFIAPRNGFAMSFRDFIPHLNGVLDQLGMSLHARTVFVNNNMSAFASHRNIAYRFLSPGKIAAAIDITVTSDPCVFTRIFLIFRGVSDDEMSNFTTAGEKEANGFNWREAIGWSEDSKDQSLFRVLETSVLEVA